MTHVLDRCGKFVLPFFMMNTLFVFTHKNVINLL